MTCPPHHRFARAALLFALLVFRLNLAPAAAQTPTTVRPWTYRLVEDGSLIDDCPICGRPSFLVPMRGTFQLRLIENTPFVVRYAVEDIRFTAGNRPYRVTGSGTFEIGGDFALTVSMSLETQIDNGYSTNTCFLTSGTVLPDRRWPMMNVTLVQTNGTPTQVFTLRLAAAPLREIWFSTASSFTATFGTNGMVSVGGGDLVSTVGRVVKRNADLFTSVGAYPPVPDLGLDAVDVLPGGEIAFSLGSNIGSQTLGPLRHGDLLSNKGRIIARNPDLLAAFFKTTNADDLGLHGARALDSGEVLFCIATNVFSDRLNTTLHAGDLLSSSGTILRSNAQLLARFHPDSPAKDRGLDAFHLWPNGEIWFSTGTGFTDSALGAIGDGDLLSDAGYIVFRNPELLEAFAPSPAPTNSGLDALYVVTDATPPAPAPVLRLQRDNSSGDVGLSWQGKGRVFQVERSGFAGGPFLPLGPIMPDLLFGDPGMIRTHSQSFYRLDQW